VSAAQGATHGPAWFGKAQASVNLLYREMAKFGVVGAVAFVVDIGVFNLMRTGVIGGDHGLAEKPLTAKTISVLAATIVAWLGNRYWTFRHRRRASLKREFALFLLMNVGGLAIALACLGFSHYVLGLTSTLADNVAGNVIGLALGTLFRFWAYRQLVFTTPDEQSVILGEPVNEPRSVLAEDSPAPSASTLPQAGTEQDGTDAGHTQGDDADSEARTSDARTSQDDDEPALVLDLRELDELPQHLT
jgi:putative flippase GtrA